MAETRSRDLELTSDWSREREDKTTLTQRDSDRRIGERLHDEVSGHVARDS